MTWYDGTVPTTSPSPRGHGTSPPNHPCLCPLLSHSQFSLVVNTSFTLFRGGLHSGRGEREDGERELSYMSVINSHPTCLKTLISKWFRVDWFGVLGVDSSVNSA